MHDLKLLKYVQSFVEKYPHQLQVTSFRPLIAQSPLSGRTLTQCGWEAGGGRHSRTHTLSLSPCKCISLQWLVCSTGRYLQFSGLCHESAQPNWLAHPRLPRLSHLMPKFKKEVSIVGGSILLIIAYLVKQKLQAKRFEEKVYLSKIKDRVLTLSLPSDPNQPREFTPRRSSLDCIGFERAFQSQLLNQKGGWINASPLKIRAWCTPKIPPNTHTHTQIPQLATRPHQLSKKTQFPGKAHGNGKH